MRGKSLQRSVHHADIRATGDRRDRTELRAHRAKRRSGVLRGERDRGQQVILRFGNQDTPRIFSARIDFQSKDPAQGTLWFFDAKVLAAGTEAADLLRANLAHLIEEMSPGSVLEESSDPVVVATWKPDENWSYEGRNRHRRK
jgi:hypothetical protein